MNKIFLLSLCNMYAQVKLLNGKTNLIIFIVYIMEYKVIDIPSKW